MKTKKSYEKPLTAVTQVELESPICSGSAIITNNHEDQSLAIENQSVNTSFDYTPTGSNGSSSSWDNISSITQQ